MFECPICQRVLHSQSILDGHLNIHFENKPFECEDCHQNFYSTKSLSRHKRTHKDPNFICKDCTKPFFERYKLKRHSGTCKLNLNNKKKETKEILLEEKVFDKKKVKKKKLVQCPECGKTLQISSLKTHLDSIHKNIYFECECKKRYKYKKSYKTHIEICKPNNNRI